MTSSRENRVIHRRSTALLVALIAFLMCAAIEPRTAWAQDKTVGTLEVECIDGIQLDCASLTALPVQVSPAAIDVGVPCGMTDMCGQDPCLCGAVDEYGACACNGMQTIEPEITVSSSDESVVKPLNVFGDWYLLSTGSGSATVTVRGSLVHYGDGIREVMIEVSPIGLLGAMRLALPIVAIALVFFLLRGRKWQNKMRGNC